MLTSLINEIHQSGTQMTLVIDDWHQVTDRRPSRRCATCWTTSVRTDRGGDRPQPGRAADEPDADAGRTGRNRRHGTAFRHRRIENFLVDLSGLDLDRSDVEELTAKTDGWVAALQLASLSLRGGEDPARLIGTLTGHHYAISAFLAENVLDTLEPSMLDFLLATSITERICGELASVLSGVPDGQTMLEQVEERDLFLRRIDEQWFRYYQLFREYLAPPARPARAGRGLAPHRLGVVRRAPHGQRSGRSRAGRR